MNIYSIHTIIKGKTLEIKHYITIDIKCHNESAVFEQLVMNWSEEGERKAYASFTGSKPSPSASIVVYIYIYIFRSMWRSSNSSIVKLSGMLVFTYSFSYLHCYIVFAFRLLIFS